MKRHILYLLCLLVVFAGFSSCKKVESKSVDNTKTIVYKDGTTVTKTYKVVPPKDKKQPEKKAPKAKKAKKAKVEKPKHLFTCKAKQLLRKQLRDAKEDLYLVPVRIGYYECNDYEERLNLLKLAANKIITLQCDEIVTPAGSTYWVTVDLTLLGRWYKESPDKKLFPEDRITEEEAKLALLPKLDQDQWGIPSTDDQVPPQIVEAMRAFYAGLQAGNTYDQSLMDAKMQCALTLLNTLASYGVDKLEMNPFTRGAELTEEMVQNLTVLRMPRMENAYLVTVGETSFLYVIEADETNVTIVDLAYIAPNDLKSLNQTVCSLAGKITKEEILAAREAKRQRDEMEARMREAMARMPQPQQPAQPEDDIEMCETSGSLKMVEHQDPTLYELAKKAEHFEKVLLRAGKVKVVAVKDMKAEGNKKLTNVWAKVTCKLTGVNAMGRIYLGLKNGETDTQPVYFQYTEDDGWKVLDQEPAHMPKPCAQEAQMEQPAYMPQPAQEEEAAMPFEMTEYPDEPEDGEVEDNANLWGDLSSLLQLITFEGE